MTNDDLKHVLVGMFCYAGKQGLLTDAGAVFALAAELSGIDGVDVPDHRAAASAAVGLLRGA